MRQSKARHRYSIDLGFQNLSKYVCNSMLMISLLLRVNLISIVVSLKAEWVNNMRSELYNMLVNRVPGINYRYHRFHDGTAGVVKALSWGYLLALNIGYHFLFLRFLGKTPEILYYEKKPVPTKISESAQSAKVNKNLSVDEYVNKLKEYEVISFDVFDTLIFRPLSQPVDVFYLMGEKIGMLDFKNIRIWAEWDARVKCYQKNGHMEIGLADIWNNLAEDTGLDAERGMQLEWETEASICYANPFMLEVWKRLIELGKKIIIVSDMYLSRDQIGILLNKNGFIGASEIYVSCEHGISKADGKLYEKVLSDLFPGKADRAVREKRRNISQRIIHVGDNPVSDVKNAKLAGFDSLHYPNINRNEMLYRARDMSYMVGAAYRGLVNAHIYNGLKTYSMEYEYGYIYGGLFVLGYCSFIHDYYVKENLDKLLFLSRDGDILLKAYRLLYPDGNAEYAYLSRKSVTKLMADIDKHDFFRRFIYHKINQEYTIREVLKSMELESLVSELSDWPEIFLDRRKKEEKDSKALAMKQLQENTELELEKYPDRKKQIDKRYEKIRGKVEETFREEYLQKIRKKDFVDLKPTDELTDKNGYLLRRFIEAKWNKVREIYGIQLRAAGKYYGNILKDCSKAAVVDIGWAGSGAMALYRLTSEVWKLDCDVSGIVAGTNTVHNSEPDASEQFLQSGRLVSYLYSQRHNRDVLKKHSPEKGYNVFWELILSSDTPQFVGFYEGDSRIGKDDVYYSDLDITLRYGRRDVDPKGAAEIQKGILDFVQAYKKYFEKYPYMFRISGRDAYAPLLAVTGKNEKYLHVIEKKFELEINVV